MDWQRNVEETGGQILTSWCSVLRICPHLKTVPVWREDIPFLVWPSSGIWLLDTGLWRSTLSCSLTSVQSHLSCQDSSLAHVCLCLFGPEWAKAPPALVVSFPPASPCCCLGGPVAGFWGFPWSLLLPTWPTFCHYLYLRNVVRLLIKALARSSIVPIESTYLDLIYASILLVPWLGVTAYFLDYISQFLSFSWCLFQTYFVGIFVGVCICLCTSWG